jgi:P22 coat protein - gene protein 5
MANSIITPTLVVRRAIELFRNSNAFLQMVDRQWQDEFGGPSVAGQKPGSTIQIRLPNEYVLRSGPTAVPQPTTEQVTPFTVATQAGVDIAFSMVERTMSMQDYDFRVIQPAVNTLVGGIAADIMRGAENIPNLIHNVDGTGNTLTPTLNTWTMAGAYLDKLSTPRGQRRAILDPITMGRTVGAFSGLFNQQSKVGDQYETAMIKKDVLGMDWAQDATVLSHTTGVYTALPTVGGGSQTGSTITISAMPAANALKRGDIITFAGVFAVNRVTKVSTGQLAQFAVTADVNPAATSIPIYPALIPAAAGPTMAPYQTVTASPANGAVIVCLTNTGETYRNNFIFHPLAVTLAIVPMEMPTRGVVEAYRESYNGVSIRLITFYDGINDQQITRLDVLYGYKWVRPEWAIRVADAL